MTLVDLEIVPGANTEIGLLLAVLEDTTNEWRGELGTPSQEALLWQPFPGGHSIGALMLHIADVEAYWLHQIGDGQTRSVEELKLLLSEETQQYQALWPTPPAQPLSWYFAQMDAIRSRTREIVLRLNDPDHAGDGKRGKHFTLRWLLNHVISHEAYHGGQAVLLAMMHAKNTAAPF